MPVSLTAQPPSPVPLYGIPEFSGKCKGNTVMGQSIFKNKKFSSWTRNRSSLVKNLSYFIPSLKPFLPGKNQEGSPPPFFLGFYPWVITRDFRINRASFRRKSSV